MHVHLIRNKNLSVKHTMQTTGRYLFYGSLNQLYIEYCDTELISTQGTFRDIGNEMAHLITLYDKTASPLTLH